MSLAEPGRRIATDEFPWPHCFCAVASLQVLLLEAGKPSFWNKLVNLPAGVVKLFKSAIDWQYESAPEKALDGKEVYLIRGKVSSTTSPSLHWCPSHVRETQGSYVLRVVCVQTLGGSSALNVMLVHRGAASDYESWVKAGADGWTPEEALKYFKASEVIT